MNLKLTIILNKKLKVNKKLIFKKNTLWVKLQKIIQQTDLVLSN